jgi:hypothetical protein
MLAIENTECYIKSEISGRAFWRMTQQSLEIPKQSINDMKNQRTAFILPHAVGKLEKVLYSAAESSGVRKNAITSNHSVLLLFI